MTAGYSVVDGNNKVRLGLWKETSKPKTDASGAVISEGGAIFYKGTFPIVEVLNWLNDAPEEMIKVSVAVFANEYHDGGGDEKAKKAPHLNMVMELFKPKSSTLEPTNQDIRF